MSSAALLPVSSGHQEGTTKNQLSTLNGCYVPCLLNILGAVLYLRIGFAVGQMGMLGALGIMAVSEIIAYLTICSFSAIVTNGKMKGGGAYYMISRNLGPAFGGSSGLLFWFTYCINVTFNVVSFTETFIPTFLPQYDHRWGNIACSSITLFLLFIIAYMGAGAFAKVNVQLFVGLMISLGVGIGSIFFGQHEKTLRPVEYENVTHIGHYYPFAWEASCGDNCTYGIKTNLWPAEDRPPSAQCNGAICDLQGVFAIIFPAVCGMMEGANLSGDLKDPAFSIPYGTLAAVSSAFFFYVCLIIGQAGTMDKEALWYNMFVMQDAVCLQSLYDAARCKMQYFVVLGVATACLSTSLGSMFGSARILQAISRDGLVPGPKSLNEFFAVGTQKGDEPRRAVILTYIIAAAGVFIGGLDAVAPILTNFFLLTYSLTNAATALLAVAGLVNFRPGFRYYSWHTATVGAIVNLVVMFYLDVIYGSITLAIVIVVFIYIALRGPDTGWGDISQALLFHQARRFALSLQGAPAVMKFWRPSILLLVQENSPALVAFCHDLKKGGLLILGRAVRDGGGELGTDSPVMRAQEEKARLLQDVLGAKLKAFAHVIVSPSARPACQNLVLSAGLQGAMEPDIVALPLLAEGAAGGKAMPTGQCSAAEYIEILRDLLLLGKKLMLATGFDSVDSWQSAFGTQLGGAAAIDMWLLPTMASTESAESDSSRDLIMQLGYILSYVRNRKYKLARGQLRLFQLSAVNSAAASSALLEEVLAEARVAATVEIVPFPLGRTRSIQAPADPAAQQTWGRAAAETMNAVMVDRSRQSAAVLVAMPPLPQGPPGPVAKESAEAYLGTLRAFTASLPHCVLLAGGSESCITTSI